MRYGAGLLLVLGLLLALAVWDSETTLEPEPGDRIVNATQRLEQSNGDAVYTVFFHQLGTRPPMAPRGQVSQTAASGDPFVSDCYDRAVVGESLPEACEEYGIVLPAPTEEGMSRSDVLVVLAASTLMLGSLVLIARRWVGGTTLDQAGVPVPQAAPPADASRGPEARPRSAAVELVQRAEGSRDAHREAIERRIAVEGRGRARGEAIRGGTIALALATAVALLVGLSRGADAAFVSALLVFLSVAILYVLALASMLAQGEPDESFYQRLSFGMGAGIALAASGFVTLTFVAPQIEWDGVRWLF